MEFNYRILNEISRKIGDSFYIFDKEKFIDNFDNLLQSFRKIYPKTRICYSYKTNYLPYLCKIVNKKGGWAEVVSEMEYEIALKVGIPPSKIIVNGPYKPPHFIKKVLSLGSTLNVENPYEIENIEKIAKNNKKKFIKIGLRVNFPFPEKEKFSRFGLDVMDENFINIWEKLKKTKSIKIAGVHCHFPFRDLDSFQIRIRKILEIADKIFINPPEYIDIGGGFFGPMPEFLKKQFSVNIPSFQEYAQVVASKMAEKYDHLKNAQKPYLFIEPGTALVANTMYFICKVIEIKKIRDTYIAITSGSVTNFGRSYNIQRPFAIYLPNEKGTFYDNIHITGYTCMEDDFLIKNYKGLIDKDSFIVFENVGSYSINFKPPFINPHPPVIILTKNKKIFILKKQETVKNILDTYIL